MSIDDKPCYFRPSTYWNDENAMQFCLMTGDGPLKLSGPIYGRWGIWFSTMTMHLLAQPYQFAGCWLKRAWLLCATPSNHLILIRATFFRYHEIRRKWKFVILTLWIRRRNRTRQKLEAIKTVEFKQCFQLLNHRLGKFIKLESI